MQIVEYDQKMSPVLHQHLSDSVHYNPLRCISQIIMYNIYIALYLEIFTVLLHIHIKISTMPSRSDYGVGPSGAPNLENFGG